jgi:hypothetical protein
MDRDKLLIEKHKMLQDIVNTDLKKEKFIKEVLNGLGEEIKQQPNKIHKKPNLLEKLLKIFK